MWFKISAGLFVLAILIAFIVEFGGDSGELPRTGSPATSWKETEAKDFVERVLDAMAGEQHSQVAELFHYPSEWSERELKANKCLIEYGLMNFSEKFGRLLGTKEFRGRKNYFHSSIGHTDDDPWPHHGEVQKIELTATYAKEGEHALVLEIAKIDRLFWIKSISIGYNANLIDSFLKFKEFIQDIITSTKQRIEAGPCAFKN